MFASTIAKLGLPASTSTDRINAVLSQPTGTRAAAAWENEIQEYMRANGVNYQTAWASCQGSNDALYQAYLRECTARNEDSLAKQRQQEEAARRAPGSTANAFRTGNASMLEALRTANAADLQNSLPNLLSALSEALGKEPMSPVVKAALKSFMEDCYARLA